MPPPPPNFSFSELGLLAEFVCGRVDDLRGIVADANPRIVPEFKAGAKKAIRELRTLDEKLRPFYLKATARRET